MSAPDPKTVWDSLTDERRTGIRNHVQNGRTARVHYFAPVEPAVVSRHSLKSSVNEHGYIVDFWRDDRSGVLFGSAGGKPEQVE